MKLWIAWLCSVEDPEVKYEIMTKEFKYLKEGLASDIVRFLMNDYDFDMQTAFNTLYDSDTYSKISNPATGLYFHSSRYVYSFLQNELRTGIVG